MTTFPPRSGDHRFFSVFSIVISATIVAGFANTYLPKVMTGTPAVPPIIHLHAAVFASWLVLFVVQTTLVLNGRLALHRTLGTFGVILAALMVVVGTAATITVTRMGHTGIPGVEFPNPDGFLLLNLAAIAVFGIFVASGWYMRRNPQAHKRLMLLATTAALVGPGVSRLPFASGKAPVIAALVTAFLFVGPVYDLITRRRLHPVYMWGVPLAFTAVPPFAAAVGSTAAWHSIAAMILP